MGQVGVVHFPGDRQQRRTIAGIDGLVEVFNGLCFRFVRHEHSMIGWNPSDKGKSSHGTVCV